MMATVPHVTSGSGIRKFQADGFLLDIVYIFYHISLISCYNEKFFRQNLQRKSKHTFYWQ